MKLLHVISSISARTGGPIAAVRDMALAQQCLGDVSELLTVDDPGMPEIAGFPLKVHAVGPSRTQYRYSPRLVPWLREHADDYDAVVIHGLWQYGGYATWSALKGSARPYFVFTHGMLDPWFKQRYPVKHLKKWLFWPWSDYRVLRDARAVFFTCEEERMLARQSFWLYRCREAVVNLGSVEPPGDAAGQIARFHDRFPETRGRTLLLFMGRLHPKKGCDLLIEAYARVAGAHPDLHLVMAGPDDIGWGSALSSQRLNVADRITWTGMLEGDEKWGAYRAADIMTLPSHQENFGLVVTEAMACGTPVLVSNRVNIWREIGSDGAGLVCNDTVDGVEATLRSWLALDAASRQACGERARQCFVGRFEITAAARMFSATIASHLGDPALIDLRNAA